MVERRGPRVAYVPALDGLRGLPLVVMLVYHGWPGWIGGGYLSVSTFFTLSGFLITALLLVEEEATGTIALRAFWERRLRRLMPAALLGIVLASVVAVVAGTRSELWRLRWDGLGALLYFANFRFMASGNSYWEMFNRPSTLQHYWSLSIEEQFYLAYPLLLLLTSAVVGRGRGALRGVLVVLALASAATMVGLSLAGSSPARLYYGTDTRAAEILFGAVLATFLVRDGRIQPWRGRAYGLVTLASVLYVVAAMLFVSDDSPFLYRGGFALYAVATAVIINAALQAGPVAGALSLWPFPQLGMISYGAYILHWPLYLWLDAERTGLEGLPLLLLRLALTLALATLSYHYLELPVRSGRRLRGVRGTVAVPVGAVAVAGLVLALTANMSAPSYETRVWRPAPMPELGSPVPAGPVRVMILGDSLAWNIGQGFASWAQRRPGRATVWNLAHYGCGLGRDPDRVHRRELEGACESWVDLWEIEIERFRPDVVVIHSSMWDLRDREQEGWGGVRSPGDPEFDEWLLSEYGLAVDIASSRGARVVWVNAPCLGSEIPERSPLLGTGALEPGRLEHFNRVLLPALAASRPTQVEIFDLFDRVCPEGRYVAKAGRVPLRRDFLHLAHPAATELAGLIAAESFPETDAAAKAPRPQGEIIRALASSSEAVGRDGRSRERAQRHAPQ